MLLGVFLHSVLGDNANQINQIGKFRQICRFSFYVELLI